jgi:hypothetical protein
MGKDKQNNDDMVGISIPTMLKSLRNSLILIGPSVLTPFASLCAHGSRYAITNHKDMKAQIKIYI